MKRYICYEELRDRYVELPDIYLANKDQGIGYTKAIDEVLELMTKLANIGVERGTCPHCGKKISAEEVFRIGRTSIPCPERVRIEGEEIKSRIAAVGMMQKDVAEMAGINLSTFRSALRKGEISVKNLERIEKVLINAEARNGKT